MSPLPSPPPCSGCTLTRLLGWLPCKAGPNLLPATPRPTDPPTHRLPPSGHLSRVKFLSLRLTTKGFFQAESCCEPASLDLAHFKNVLWSQTHIPSTVPQILVFPHPRASLCHLEGASMCQERQLKKDGFRARENSQRLWLLSK